MPKKLSDRLVDNPIVNRTVMKRIITPVDQEHPPEGFQEARVMFFIGGGRASGKTSVNNYLFDMLGEQGIQPEYVGKLGSYAFADILDRPSMQRARNQVNKVLEKKAHASADVGDDEGKKGGGLSTKMLERAIDTIFEQGSPAVVDNHGDDPAFVEMLMAKAKEHGYETVMISPHISPETYFARERHREQETGRPPEFESGLKKHVGFARALPQYEQMFDAVLLLDNDAHGKPPTPIAYAVGGQVTVLDEGKYHDARRKADINVKAKGPDEVWQGAGREHGQGADATRSREMESSLGEDQARGARELGADLAASLASSASQQQQWSGQVLEHYIGGDSSPKGRTR